MKPHSAASNRDSKSDNRPQGNSNIKDDREKRQLNSIFNPSIVSETITREDTYDSLPEMKLESACSGGNESPKTLTKEKDEATPKSPKKVNPDDHESCIPNKTEAKNQPLQKSKSIKTADKGSTDITDDSTDITEGNTVLPKKSVVTSSDSEGEDTKKDSGNETHDIKSSSEWQERQDAPNKPKSQSHGNLSKPNVDKLGTPV